MTFLSAASTIWICGINNIITSKHEGPIHLNIITYCIRTFSTQHQYNSCEKSYNDKFTSTKLIMDLDSSEIVKIYLSLSTTAQQPSTNHNRHV